MSAPNLVTYEYAAKQAQGAAANFGWRIDADGRYWRAQNTAEDRRPDGQTDPYWFPRGWVEVTRLSADALAAAVALVSTFPLPSEHHRPARPTPRGDLSRLIVAHPDGERRVEVEDRCFDGQEAWIAKLLAAVAPKLAARAP